MISFIPSEMINAIVAATGVLTSILTIVIIRESRLMRKHYSTPEISIYLKFAEAAPTHLYIYIENLGMGTAHNVEFNILQDYKYYQTQVEPFSKSALFSDTLQHFYPKQSFRFLIDSLHDRSEEQLKEHIVLSVSYKNEYGKKYKRIFRLNIELFLGAGMLTPGDTHIRVISYHLEQMQKDINRLTSSIINSLKDK